MQPGQQQKQTPNRRRNGGRNNRTTPKQTAYASENDLPRTKPDHDAGPSTPVSDTAHVQRVGSASQKQQRSNNPTNNKKNKKARQPRNDDGASSPNRNHPDRSSPSVPIFAGSTFHASPAPSALPIPSFLSAADIDSPETKAPSSPDQGLSCTTSDSDAASPPSPPSIPRMDESPLELFFRADRAEKEKARARRASYDHLNAIDLSPFSPPHESSKEFATFPLMTTPCQPRRPSFPKRAAASGISSEELDGSPGQPVGPAFSTPYQERMRAARSNPTSARSAHKVLQAQDLNSSDDLKRYLFTGRVGPNESRSQQKQSPAPSDQTPVLQHSPLQSRKLFQRTQQPLQNQSPQHRLPRGMFPMSVLTASAQSGQPSAPPVDAQLTPYRSDELAAMEDGLRRILNLDSAHALPLH